MLLAGWGGSDSDRGIGLLTRLPSCPLGRTGYWDSWTFLGSFQQTSSHVFEKLIHNTLNW